MAVRRAASRVRQLFSPARDRAAAAAPSTPSGTKGLTAWTTQLTISSDDSFFGSDTSNGPVKSSLNNIFDKYRGNISHTLPCSYILTRHR
jgi:hypothetical protein